MSADSVGLAPGREVIKKTTWGEDLPKVLIPSLVTAVFGFLIWNAQIGIQQTVTENNQRLQSQLALKEEFYKRRLTQYEKACLKVADVKYALDVAWETPENETKAMEKLAELDELKRSNVLYWSDDLNKRLGVLWTLGIKKIRHKQFKDQTTNENIGSEIVDLHRRMKDDLAVDEISRVPSHGKESD